jgi:hypothetical protein
MKLELFAKLPKEIVHHIVSYDKRFKVRKGRVVDIIPYDDGRRSILATIPPIDCEGHVFLSDSNDYEVHTKVDISGGFVYWTLYKYYKTMDEDEECFMDGIVFSMRQAYQSAEPL